MALDKILAALFSLGGIAFTYQFFLMKKNEKITVVKNNSIDITVEGGYSPDTISIPKNETSILNFIRRDTSSCLEEVIIPDFKIRKFLPLYKKVSIPITPHNEGQHEISCGMNMFHGKIIVT